MQRLDGTSLHGDAELSSLCRPTGLSTPPPFLAPVPFLLRNLVRNSLLFQRKRPRGSSLGPNLLCISRTAPARVLGRTVGHPSASGSLLHRAPSRSKAGMDSRSNRGDEAKVGVGATLLGAHTAPCIWDRASVVAWKRRESTSRCPQGVSTTGAHNSDQNHLTWCE
ncbi:hypothetical protein BJV78DRAFT_930664 [Lactifluus subvellereus]|nr:hypothetical protein BJV78DRAFT_930664 [Lactifluus subvellereus]